MPLSQAQQQVADSRARFKVLVTGRRFGKTHLAIRQLCYNATRPNSRVWYIAPSYRQAKNIVWQQLKDRLRPLRWIDRINESDLSIRLVNGSEIALKGADNEDSLRGVGLDYVVMDEMQNINSDAWNLVIRPTLSDRNGGALFTGTPMGIGNYFYDLYTHAGTDPQWSRWQFTTLDGGNVPESEIEQAKKDLHEIQFRQEYLGTFEAFQSAIYYKFDAEHNVDELDIPAGARIHIGLDFNVDPHQAACCVRTETGLHVFDEISIAGSSTEIMAQEIRNRYGNNQITIYPDASGAQRRTSAGGKTDIMILQNAGFEVRVKHRNPPVKDRINAVNSLLCNTNGDRRLTVSPKCKRVIATLSRHRYKESTQIPDDGDLSHMGDALGYCVEYQFPVTRNINTSKEPRVFKHRTY